MKKISLLIITILLAIIVVSCGVTKPDDTDDPIDYYTVTFDAKGGSSVEPITVEEGGLITAPDNPEKDGYTFRYWFLTDEDVAFVFDTPITSHVTLTASWDKEPEPEEVIPITDLIYEDIEAIQEQLYNTYYDLNLATRGPVNGTVITWISNNKYISTAGIVLPLLDDESEDTTKIQAKFVLSGVTINHEFDIDLYRNKDVVLEVERIVPFYNLTEEYDVLDSEIELLFEKDGSVPYVRVEDFMKMLSGFIDPEIDIMYETSNNTLQIKYDYYDKDDKTIYPLEVTIDADANTLVAPDPGFYWGYVYSTATNFGRHINYDRDNPGTYYSEGEDLVYDLNKYNMDIIIYEGEVVLPYYMANQLLAGSSYYNVYYNYDGLYGIYALPDENDDAYKKIRNSSKNSKELDADLVIHTFNFLAFSMDNFYGLKDFMEVETYYDVLFEYRDNLLSKSALRLEGAINDFLVKRIDEPHTNFGYPGYYNRASYKGPTILGLGGYGPRFRTWYNSGLNATNAAIGEKWGVTSGNAWNASNPNRKLYWFLDQEKQSAVLSLDSFSTSDINESAVWSNDILLSILKRDTHSFPKLEGGTKYFYYNESSQDKFIAEVLIKGLKSTDVSAYKTLLENQGFIKTSTDLSYSKIVDGVTNYVAISYNDLYKTITVSYSIQELIDTKEPLFINDSFELIMSDSAVYMEFQLELIAEEATNLENIILDITWNTGGNVGALYRVIGFITDKSFAVSSISADTNTNSTSYVLIDGVPSYSHLNWALLVTPTSFSAANSLATIFKENNLGPIIGIKSGGGASSITPVLLPNGTAFTMSSNNMSAYRTGTGTTEDPFVYHPNEMGIDPTHPISMNNIYDEVTLNKILKTYYNV